MQPTKTGCVILAAGSATRFGENKLLLPFRGKPLAAHALTVLPKEVFHAVAVVTRFPVIEEAARAHGFLAVRNDAPERGQSESVRRGVQAIGEACDAILFLVADQPLLTEESIRAVLDCGRLHPEAIIAASAAGRRGNPCLFPSVYFQELLSLTGDGGGSAVIRNHPEALVLCEIPARELQDIDTPEDLRKLASHP